MKAIEKKNKVDKWTKTTEQLPKFDEELEITYDNGKTFENGASYQEERICMMAGVAGGNGYFGEGFACSSDSKADTGLILDTPAHWRYK